MFWRTYTLFTKVPGKRTSFYTDLWWWIGQDADYQADEKLLARAPAHVKCKFMNSLRARETSRSLMQSGSEPRSMLYDQAESRLHKKTHTRARRPRQPAWQEAIASRSRILSRGSPEVQQLLEK